MKKILFVVFAAVSLVACNTEKKFKKGQNLSISDVRALAKGDSISVLLTQPNGEQKTINTVIFGSDESATDIFHDDIPTGAIIVWGRDGKATSVSFMPDIFMTSNSGGFIKALPKPEVLEDVATIATPDGRWHVVRFKKIWGFLMELFLAGVPFFCSKTPC